MFVFVLLKKKKNKKKTKKKDREIIIWKHNFFKNKTWATKYFLNEQ